MKFALLLAPLLAIPPLAMDAAPTTRPATAPQAAATTPAEDASTPRGALRAYDRALLTGGMKAALSAYQASSDRERKAAEAMAKADLAGAKLQELARQKFGDKAAQEVVHAMRQASAADLDAAEVHIEGNKATINWADDREALEMVKVNGAWKVSVGSMLGDDDDALQDLVDTNDSIAKAFDHTAQELEAGQYANPYLLERAIKQRMFRVLGEDD